MELQTLLVLCGIGVAGIAVVLLMGLFSASGTSYEEAIAQQRKAATELLALAEGKNKPKKNKKANKKLAKKEKNKEATSATGSEPEVESEAPVDSAVEDDTVPAAKPHVEFRPPVVVNVPVDMPPVVKIRKRGKDPKVKPILLNKEDPSCVSVPSALAAAEVALANHFEEMHPKDEFELLYSTLSTEKTSEKKEKDGEKLVEKKDVKAAKASKVKAAGKPAAGGKDEPREEPPRDRRSSADPPKEQRKGKKSEKKPATEEVYEVRREEAVAPLNALQPSELTTEKLLRQVVSPTAAAPAPDLPASAPPTSHIAKNKKKKPEPNVLSLMAAGDGGGVNVGELVRVVREAALSRTEIQILTDALLNKHHDPLPQHSEWTEGPNDPMQKLKKQLADKEKALADEIEASQALSAKLKELRASLNAERGRCAASARVAEQAAAAARAELHTLQARLQRLLDDNHQLQQDKHLLQSKLGEASEAQAQRVQLEMHIQRLSESEAALVQQVAALQAEAGARAVEAGQARCDAAAARDATLLAQQHVADLAHQLQEANRAYSEVEQQRQCAARGEQAARDELRQLQDRLAAMNDLQGEVQRLTSRAQATEKSAEQIKEEAEKQKQQLLKEIATLKENLAARESELAETKQMKVVPAQNGLPPNDQIKGAEMSAVEGAVEALRAELAAAQRGATDHAQQIAALKEQLATYQAKNDELRTKNWKVMEALQSAEKALQAKSGSAMPAQDSLRESILKAQEAQYNEVASILRGACPTLAPKGEGGREWVAVFAENVRAELTQKDRHAAELERKMAEAAATGDDRALEELKAQNEQLQALCDKYKKIIDDTEGVLSRLQQNVTAEEQRWAQQLEDAHRELDDLKHKTVMQMQKKIEGLQRELEAAQAQAANHTGFADAERHAEERLMVAGLSEKHTTDVSNGPLQVGLQEK